MLAKDYSEVEDVEIDGVKFKIGWIPSGKWRLLIIAQEAVRRAAIRRTLIALKAQGNASPTPEETYDALIFDAEFVEGMEKLKMEAAAWGVRGHSGLKTSSGAEVPFKGETREYLGKKYEGASMETVATYQDVGSLLSELYTRASEKNSLGESQKKSSAPLPDTSTDDGTATTA